MRETDTILIGFCPGFTLYDPTTQQTAHIPLWFVEAFNKRRKDRDGN